MDSMTTPSSALTRYRPVVLSITGFAAIYGIYLVYTTSRPAPTTPLHRSGAVHRRPRNSRFRQAQPPPPPPASNREPRLDPSTTYGHFEFQNSNGDRTFLDLRADRLPTLEYFLAEAHNPDTAQLLVDQAQSIYLDRFFAVVLGPAELAAAQEGVRVDRDRIRSWLGSHGVASSNIDVSLTRFELAVVQLAHQRLQAGDDEDGQALASLDNIYGRRGNSLPGTEVGVHHRQRDTEGQNLKQLLYYIAEEQSKQEGYVHRGVSCNACDTKPLRGTRWRCANCPDFDLCTDCHSVGMHSKTHIFYEIKIPAPFVQPRQSMPVAYPGKPHLMPRSLPAEVCKRLVNETNYEKHEVEGLYDQFTCIASYRWLSDPNKLGAAIDRQSFEAALFPVTSLNPPRPNLIYDRIFALYDSNADGLVGFEEFLQGLACLHNRSKDSNQRLRKVFDGYDVDADGYVSRKDFLRIFRAFYAIQKELVRDLLLAQQEELTVDGAMDTITSSMPLSSAFTGIQIPSQSQDAPEGKAPDRFGDMRSAESPILDSREDTADRTRILTNSWEAREGFPFDPDTGEPRTQRPWDIQIGDGISREHREVHFAHGGRPIEEARDDAIRDRWRRRRFYTDEEEGVQLANGRSEHRRGFEGAITNTEDDDGIVVNLPSPALRQTPEGSRPASPRSRSSSKVRFQDDVDFDTRSNASTSSRPFNERYGGYEIPEAEKDYGREIIYQVVEDGMNELLDPLFKDKEDLAMEVYATKFERRKWKAEIAAFKDRRKAWDDFTKAAAHDPLLATAEAVQKENIPMPSGNAPVLDEVSQLVVDQGPEEAISQIEQRINSQSLEELLRENGHPVTPSPAERMSPNSAVATLGLSPEDERMDSLQPIQPLQDRVDSAIASSPESSRTFAGAAEPLGAFETPERWNVRYDPTMPQFRPNSEDEPRPLEYDPTQIIRGPTAPYRRFGWRHHAAPGPSSEYSDSIEPDHPSEPNNVEEEPELVALPPRQERAANGATRGSDRDIIERFTSVVLGWDNAVVQENHRGDKKNDVETRRPNSPPPDTRLRVLAYLDDVNREIDTRGGPGRLSFEEFEKFIKGGRKEGRQLAFVEEWLDLGSF
jgi:Ca2+-binding EF-hand superfamily protein